MGRDVDGLIIATTVMSRPDVIQNIAEAGIPMVLVETVQVSRSIPSPPIIFAAGRVMTEYLIKLGHRRIRAIGGPDKYSSLPRSLCVVTALPCWKMVCRLTLAQPSPVSGQPRKGTCKCRSLSPCPIADGCFRGERPGSLWAMEAIKDAGLVCPDDISVAGIDDVRDSAYSTPSLTTFRVPKYDLGQNCGLVLHNLTQISRYPCQNCSAWELLNGISCSATPKTIRG